MSATETERRPATPEEIWEILRQVAIRQKEGEALKEARKERRELREQMEETDRRLRREACSRAVGPADGVASRGIWEAAPGERRGGRGVLPASRDPKQPTSSRRIAVEVKST